MVFLKNFQSQFETIIGKVADFLWGDWLLIALLSAGLLYSLWTRFIQVRKFPLVARRVLSSKKVGDGEGSGISPFHALLMALGSCMGSGNIVGVATALIAGGPGALFWMWLAAFLGMAVKYGEVLLGMVSREVDEEGRYIGGPMYYIANAFKTPIMGIIVAVLLFIQNAGGTLIQSNVIAGIAGRGFGLPTYVTAVISAVLMSIIIRGGFKRLVEVEKKLVPFMSILYILGGLIVIFANITSLPAVFASIFKGAFTVRAGIGGFGGAAIRYGIARGLYSNEAGEGSAAVIHSSANNPDPADQGLYGIMEVFVDTIIVCSSTGFAILFSGVDLTGANANTLAADAFATIAGPMRYIVYVALLLFAFTSLMSQWYFGHVSLRYLHSKKGDDFYKVFFPIAIVIGSLTTINVVWSIQDCALGLLIIPNLIALAISLNRVRDLTDRSGLLRRRKEDKQ